MGNGTLKRVLGAGRSVATRVVVVEDHAIFREALLGLVESDDALTVVGQARDGEGAIALAQRLHPDVVLMDIGLPRMNGIDATRRIVSADAGAKVIVVSIYNDATHVFHAFRSGASGYVLKDSAGRELLPALHAVTSGRAYVSDALRGQLRSALPEGAGSEHSSPYDLLTEEERQVLQLLVEGLTFRQVSGHLSIDRDAVETHFANLRIKTQTAGMSDLVIYAIRWGLTAL